MKLQKTNPSAGTVVAHASAGNAKPPMNFQNDGLPVTLPNPGGGEILRLDQN